MKHHGRKKGGTGHLLPTGGGPIDHAPVPDISFVEDFVNFPMLFHEKPESILILKRWSRGGYS